ncbi:MAG: hypothetical protein ABIL58_09170 [Pseudomonadota bacterium]
MAKEAYNKWEGISVDICSTAFDHWYPITQEGYANAIKYWYYTDSGVNIINNIVDELNYSYTWNKNFFASSNNVFERGFDIRNYTNKYTVLGYNTGGSYTGIGTKFAISSAITFDWSGNLTYTSSIDAGAGQGRDLSLFGNVIVGIGRGLTSSKFGENSFSVSGSHHITETVALTGAVTTPIDKTNNGDWHFVESGLSFSTPWGTKGEIGETIGKGESYTINLVDVLNNIFEYNPQ